MSITEKQREARKNHIGSTDVAKILGVSVYGTAYDLWLEKTDRLEGKKKQTEDMESGIILEPSVLNWAEKELGLLMSDPRKLEYRAEDLPLIAHPDAIVIDTGEPVEAKTCRKKGQYGEAGTNQVPPEVIIQTHAQLMCLNGRANHCHIPVLHGYGLQFAMYGIDQDKELSEIIADAVITFWEKHVLRDIPPEDTEVSYAVAKRIKRIPNKIANLPEKLVRRCLAGREAMKAIKKSIQKEEAEIFRILDGAEEGTVPDYGKVICSEVHRKGYVVKDCIYKQLRFKEEKGSPGLIETGREVE